ncbi:uncharacterized protein LOC144555237 [Carex rostrata]
MRTLVSVKLFRTHEIAYQRISLGYSSSRTRRDSDSRTLTGSCHLIRNFCCLSLFASIICLLGIRDTSIGLYNPLSSSVDATGYTLLSCWLYILLRFGLQDIDWKLSPYLQLLLFEQCTAYKRQTPSQSPDKLRSSLILSSIIFFYDTLDVIKELTKDIQMLFENTCGSNSNAWCHVSSLKKSLISACC